MLLAIDIGNTHIKFGLFTDSRLEHKVRLATDPGRTEDEYGVLLVQALAQRGIGVESVHASILASVVPALTDGILAMVRRLFGREPLVLGPGLKTGISVLYDSPREVGPDRIADAVAAFERVKGGTIVVDFGTATTFDAVGPDGAYLGGAIAPGLRLGLEALASKTALLPKVELRVPDRAIARDTVNAIRAGAVLGHQAMTAGLLAAIRSELAETAGAEAAEIRVVLTGGLSAEPWARSIEGVDAVDPDLTLKGLAILHAEVAGGEPLAIVR